MDYYAKSLRRGVKFFVIAIAIVLLIRTFAFTPCYIPSTGMESSLLCGDYVLLNRWSYGWRVPLTDYSRWLSRPVQINEMVVYDDPSTAKSPLLTMRKQFVSRCVGLPGDTLLLNYLPLDQLPFVRSHPDYKQIYRLRRSVCNLSRYEVYLLQQQDTALQFNPIKTPIKSYPFVLPKCGIAVKIVSENVMLYARIINLYERHQALVRNGKLWVDGHQKDWWTFSDDYYWMSSNNILNLHDSRTFGPVSFSQIIGRISCVLVSRDVAAGLFALRWGRTFQTIK